MQTSLPNGGLGKEVFFFQGTPALAVMALLFAVLGGSLEE